MDGFKTWLLTTTGLSQDALHTYLGFVVFFGAALLLRKPPSAWTPWIVVMVFSIIKEGWDVIYDTRVQGQWSGFKSAVDFASTVFWPTVIMFMVRHGVVFRKQ